MEKSGFEKNAFKGLGGFQRLKTGTFVLFLFLYMQWNILFKQFTV